MIPNAASKCSTDFSMFSLLSPTFFFFAYVAIIYLHVRRSDKVERESIHANELHTKRKHQGSEYARANLPLGFNKGVFNKRRD